MKMRSNVVNLVSGTAVVEVGENVDKCSDMLYSLTSLPTDTATSRQTTRTIIECWCISTLQINTLTCCELREDFPKISNILRASFQTILVSNSKMFDHTQVDLTMPLTNIYVLLSLDERKLAECHVEV